jgi:hypothetical protein
MSDKKLTQEAPALVGIGAQSIVDRGRKLGLTWSLRPATVMATNNIANLSGIQIQYDGDNTTLQVANLSGQSLQVGDRVMGLEVPPSANYIVGRLGSPAVGLGYWDSISSTAPVAFTGETVILNIASVQWLPLRAYEIKFRADILTTTGTNAAVWRIREDGIAGTVLGVGVWAARNIQSNDWGSDLIVVNSTKTTVTADLTLTMAATAGTLTASGTASQLIWLRVYDIGPSFMFPNTISV